MSELPLLILPYLGGALATWDGCHRSWRMVLSGLEDAFLGVALSPVPALLTLAGLVVLGVGLLLRLRFRFYINALPKSGLAVLGMGLFRRRTDVDPASLLLASVPAFASLTLQAGLWMTPALRWMLPFLGDAPYAPYDPADTDVFRFFTLYFVTLWVIVSVAYGSYKYLAVTGVAQASLGFVTYVFPRCYPFGIECLLWDSLWLLLMMLPYLGGVLVIWRRNARPRRRKPGLWMAVALTGLAGAWTLYSTLNWFPQNGQNLRYMASDLFVPDGAWDWARSAAQFAAMAAMVIAVPGGIIAVLWNHRRCKPALAEEEDVPTGNVD